MRKGGDFVAPRRAFPVSLDTWAIHSVPVRIRDGGERLDQVYRRLLGEASG